MPAPNGKRKPPLHRQVRRETAPERALKHLAAHLVSRHCIRDEAYGLAFLIWSYALDVEPYAKLITRALLAHLHDMVGAADYIRDPEFRARERNRREAFVEAVHVELAKLERETETRVAPVSA